MCVWCCKRCYKHKIASCIQCLSYCNFSCGIVCKAQTCAYHRYRHKIVDKVRVDSSPLDFNDYLDHLEPFLKEVRKRKPFH